MIVAFDMDDVCADLVGEWCRRISLLTGEALTFEDIHGWNVSDYTKLDADLVYRILTEPDLYDIVIPLPKARAAVREVRAMGHRVVFVTACIPGTEQAKLAWLHRWGFFPDGETIKGANQDFFPVQDKSLIRADILFDDKVENVLEFKGHGCLVRRPHNLSKASQCPMQVQSISQAPALVRLLLQSPLP